MRQLIEKRHKPPAFPLAPYRVRSVQATTLAFPRFLEYSAAYQALLDRRYRRAQKSNRAAEGRGEYMLSADGKAMRA